MLKYWRWWDFNLDIKRNTQSKIMPIAFSSYSSKREIPTTGIYVIDYVFTKYCHRFKNGFVLPWSVNQEQNTIPIDMAWSGNSSVEICNVFETTEGMFMVTRNKNERENTHSLPSILRDVLMALDRLSPYHSFPRNYQDFIIRQVVCLPIASPSLLPPCGCRPDLWKPIIWLANSNNHLDMN